MQINSNTIVSVTEANQNFSRVSRIAEKNGQAVIFKNNRPKYMLIDLESNPMLELTDDERSTSWRRGSSSASSLPLRSWQNDQVFQREGAAAP